MSERFAHYVRSFKALTILRFLPAVIDAAATKGISMKEKYERIVAQSLTRDEHLWIKRLTQKEAEELRKLYEKRYNQYVACGTAKNRTHNVANARAE